MLWVVAKDGEREMDGGEWEEEIQKRECGLIISATSTSISVRATGPQQQGNAFGRTIRAHKPTQQRDKGTFERTMG